MRFAFLPKKTYIRAAFEQAKSGSCSKQNPPMPITNAKKKINPQGYYFQIKNT